MRTLLPLLLGAAACTEPLMQPSPASPTASTAKLQTATFALG